MYLKKVSIKNIKSIEDLSIEFDSPFKGWNILLGDNGSGKSTILKAISLCLIGERQGYALKQNFKNWITKGKHESKCQIDLVLDSELDVFANKYNNKASYLLKIDKEGNLELNFKTNGKSKRVFPIPSHGWYSSAFGPYRRLGDRDTKEISSFTNGNLENHITLFDASYNLSNALEWLKDLKFQKLNSPIMGSSTYDDVINFINNSELLPNNVKIDEVNHEGVFFIDGENRNIEINSLSDGYQSIFSISIEILRQISKSFDLKKVFKKERKKYSIIASGVILIDEVDIHLHPQWQSKIGEWFKKHFPNMQFIVSTHSPIICQSAENGSIWKIEHLKTGRPSHKVEGQEFNRMVYGNLIDSIGTDNFGLESIERSEKSKEMLDKLAKLNLKSIRGVATKEEKLELKRLKSILPSED